MTTIPQDNQQVNSPQENPDETAAVLAFATKLQEGLLPKAPQTQEMGSPSDSNMKEDMNHEEEQKMPNMEEHKEEMKKEMGSMMKEMKEEMKEMIKEEISTIKESIENALNEDEE